MLKKIGIGILVVISLIGIAFGVYVSNGYKPDEVALEIYKKNDEQLAFESENTELGFIIYPGGKVDEVAYIRMAQLLNDEGYTAVVEGFPFDIGFFGINNADKTIEKYKDIDKWIIIGHSLGGVTASEYVYKNPEHIEGIVFLASYPTKDLKDLDMKTLYIRAENDKVLELESYEEGKATNSENFEEIVIDGGNHAGFANYGTQKGDGKNTIGDEEQQRLTVKAILELVSTDK